MAWLCWTAEDPGEPLVATVPADARRSRASRATPLVREPSLGTPVGDAAGLGLHCLLSSAWHDQAPQERSQLKEERPAQSTGRCAADRTPAPETAGLAAESGRGLLLVETLSSHWGCFAADHQDGKIVWAMCVADAQDP